MSSIFGEIIDVEDVVSTQAYNSRRGLKKVLKALRDECPTCNHPRMGYREIARYISYATGIKINENSVSYYCKEED